METSKLGYANASVLSNSVAPQRNNNMDIQAPRTAVFVRAVPALTPQPPPTQEKPPPAPQDPTTLHLTVAPLFSSKQTIPFLTFQVGGGLQLQPQGPSPAAAPAAAAPTAKPKSSGKHVCRHCGRDCMKPSVLEKHLRCHTGERPYPCATCGISFKTQSNLYKHKRTQAHARLSFESGSLRASSTSSCGDLSREVSADESGSQDRDAGGLPAPVTGSADVSRDISERAPGGDTADLALQQAEVSNGVLPVKERKEANSLGKDTEPPEADTEKAGENDDEKAKENQKPAPASNRHVPLQRQEAARFSKRWESSASRGKSQSHDSTDSGFSESSEQLWGSSPGSALPGYSMESLTESCMELGNASDRTPHANAEPSRAGQEPKTAVSVQEQQTLEERISKLISENDAVVDDKHLENVRPRKTVLSKQGSIDLPVPYTYKDSFHFEMKTAAGLARRTPDRGGRLGLHGSVPTQPSTSVEHAPLTRSSSLPFGVTLLRSERSAPASQNDPVAPARRGSSGHVHSGDGVGGKCAHQQVSNHRPLVRQAAVDCVTATEGPARNPSVEEALAGGPSLDGESVEACGESSGRKSGKKKTQKFAYSKWYMYGGGTFKKMYSTTQSCDNVALKTRKSLTNLDREKDQGIQRRLSSAHKDPVTATGSSTDSPALSTATTCSTSCLPANPPSVTGLNQTAGLFHSPCAPHKPPLTRSFSLSTMQSSSIASPDSHKKDIANQNMFEKVVYKEHSDLVSQGPIPSERKKQRTENATMCPLGTQIESTTSKTLTQSFPPIAGTGSGRPQLHGNNVSFSFDWPRHLTPSKGTVSSPCILNSNGTYGGVSTVSSNSSAKAKTTFLPKYQLKLPNAMETESVALPSILNQTTLTGHPVFMTAPEFSSNIYPPSTTATPSTLSNQQCITPMLSPLGATHRMNIPAVCPAQGAVAPAPPVTVTHQSLSLTSITGPGFNVVSDGPRLRERHVAITKTTASLLANPTTALQPIRPARHSLTERDSAHSPLTTPSPASGQQSSSGSAHNQCPPLSFTPEAASSHHTHSEGSVKSGSRSPTLPCHIVPFSDSAQPATPNIFHVRTADLQICLQIISDEQLALIEPHIERHGVACDANLLSRKGRDAREERTETNVGNAAVAEESSIQDSSSEWTGLEKQTDPADFPASQDAENITNAPTVLFPQTGSGTRVRERGDVSPVERRFGWPANAMRTGPDGRDPPLPRLRPQILTGGSEQTPLTIGGVASLTASREGEKLLRNQVTVMEDVLSLRTPPEQPLWPKEEGVSQKGTFPETLSGQSKLCLAAVASLSPAPQAQSSSGSKSLKLVGQHKPLNHEATCNTGTLKTGREASDHEARSSERAVNGERGRSRQAWPGARSLIEGCGGPSSKPPLLFNDNSHGVERGTPRSPERAVTERAGQPLPLAGMVLNERDRSNPNHMDNPLGQITSEPDSGLEEKPKDGTAVLETHRGKAETVGVTGGPPTGRDARTEPETPASTGGTPPQPDAPDKEHTEGRREGTGTDGGGDNRVRSGAQKDRVLGQREGESARDGGGECHFNSGLAVRDPSIFFPGQTILFGSPQKQARWDASPSDSPRCLESGTCTAFNGARPEIETDCVHVLQRPGRSETQEESSLLQISRAFSRAEAGNAQTPPLCVRSEASSNPNHHQTEDRGGTAVPLPQGSPPMCYNNSISLSEQQRPASPLPVARAPPSSLLPQPAHCERDSCGATGSSQADDDRVPTAQFDLFQPCISMDSGRGDKAERVHTAPVGDPVRPGGSDRYPSLLSTDQLYGCQFAGCQAVGVRLVQGGHDDSDVASSSDDEGKLIIEL